MNGPILVTGAAGFAGSHLLDLLGAADVPVVAWRRPGEALPPPPTGGACRWMEVDVLDRDNVEHAVREAAPSAVYHLAGAAHVGTSWDDSAATLAVNVLGTWHLLASLAALPGRPRTLVSGSALVYARQDRAISEDDPVGPASPYAVSKLAQELAAAHAVRELGLPVVITRSFNHIGPRQSPSFSSASFARQIALAEAGRGPRELLVGNLDPRRDLTDVRDIVAAYRALLDAGAPGRVYNVCSGHAVRVRDVLDGLAALARVPIDVRVDEALLRPHDTPLVLGNPRRIREEIGWEPRIGLADTLRDLLDYWREAILR
ncbi:MAG TPA: GDP-mannose 4,6-dehydratase [Vicinamibacterales bacterium]|nr:GDP-mannose 4,6-dehydratase [Acidobacteriota bacterium]HOC16630.1 GDP-mannose 4,6-dehydratase [Vicinamibacterales bacterium]